MSEQEASAQTARVTAPEPEPAPPATPPPPLHWWHALRLRVPTVLRVPTGEALRAECLKRGFPPTGSESERDMQKWWLEAKHAARHRLWFIAVSVTAAAAWTAVISGRSQARLRERAWVGVRSETAGVGIEVGKRTIFTVPMENAGQTPARRVSMQIGANLLPSSTPFETRYEKVKNPSVSVLFPRAMARMIATREDHLTSQELADIKSGATVLYVYGRITYEDIFNERHETTFCMEYALDRSRESLVFCDTYKRRHLESSRQCSASVLYWSAAVLTRRIKAVVEAYGRGEIELEPVVTEGQWGGAHTGVFFGIPDGLLALTPFALRA